MKQFIFTNTDGYYEEGYTDGSGVVRSCDASLAVGDLVMESETISNGVDKVVDNSDVRSVIGYCVAKPTTTTAEILLAGEIDDGGGFTSTIPTGGYIKVLGYAVESNKIDFDPSVTKIKRYHLPLQVPITQVDEVYLSDTTGARYFGYNFDVKSNVMAVGDLSYSGSKSYEGRVSIYKKIGSSWQFEQHILPPSPQNSAQFGDFVVLSSDGNRLLIHESRENTGGDLVGSIYIYEYNGSSWTEMTHIDGSVNHRIFISGGIDGNNFAFYEQSQVLKIYHYNGSNWNLEYNTSETFTPSAGYIYVKNDRVICAKHRVSILDRNSSTGSWTITSQSSEAGDSNFFYSDGITALLAPTVVYSIAPDDTITRMSDLVLPSGATSHVKQGDVLGDTLILGDYSRTDPNDSNNTHAGAFYMYKFDGTDWVLKQEQLWAGKNRELGIWIIIDGDFAYISESGSSAPDEGHVHVYS